MNDTGLNERFLENSEYGKNFMLSSESSMDDTETKKNTLQKETEQTRPLTVKEYFCMYLWMLIPIANIVFMIRWAVGGTNVNVNRTNFWRGYLLTMAILTVFLIVFMVAATAIVSAIGFTTFS